jgi:hypothetical protein
MYVDSYLLLVIYLIAVLGAAISVYALWSLEEIRKHYERLYDKKKQSYKFKAPIVSKNTKSKSKGYWDINGFG